ncbi:MAG: hypothetical protein DHS20C13_02730 [Thermodesulfobacteriota bacterium]|nr:MAG: hypothetical protein DHS20C13_02730 [Thermodesulfobacteriota bacterium]
MAYSTDEIIEQYMPDILDHGVPGVIDGGVSTTLSASAASAGLTIDVADAAGLQADDFVRIDSNSNVEIVQIDSIAVNTLTLKTTTPLRKNHKSGVKVAQVDSLGFTLDHVEAKDDIDRIIEVKWFKPRVRERFGKDIELLDGNLDFDTSLMLNAGTQLKKASAYRVLGHYVCPKLSKATRNADAWEKRAEEFGKKFDEEIERVLSVGIDYDWDRSGQVDDDENRIPTTTFYVGRA